MTLESGIINICTALELVQRLRTFTLSIVCEWMGCRSLSRTIASNYNSMASNMHKMASDEVHYSCVDSKVYGSVDIGPWHQRLGTTAEQHDGEDE